MGEGLGALAFCYRTLTALSPHQQGTSPGCAETACGRGLLHSGPHAECEGAKGKASTWGLQRQPGPWFLHVEASWSTADRGAGMRRAGRPRIGPKEPATKLCC